MTYEYGSNVYATPMQASRAAVADFLYGESNSDAEVGAMDIYKCTAELKALIASGDWTVPYLDEHAYTIDELVREVIMNALECDTFQDD